jgi:hypothetical protein
MVSENFKRTGLQEPSQLLSSAIVFSLMALVGCSSAPSKPVGSVDSDLSNSQSADSGVIGVDKENHAILQKETSAADELRNQQWANNSLEASIDEEYYWLKRCRTEIADARLGGNDQVKELPEIDSLKTTSEVKEGFGLNDSGQLSFVKREDFLKRIAIERSYQVTLTGMLKTIVKNREQCEQKMGKARIAVGLPATRYQGRFTLSNTGAINSQVIENENSLDDAFRIRDRLKDSAGVPRKKAEDEK